MDPLICSSLVLGLQMCLALETKQLHRFLGFNLGFHACRQVLFQLSYLPTLDTRDLFFWFLLFRRGRQRLCCGQALTQPQEEWPPRIFWSLSFRIETLFLIFEVFMPCIAYVTKEREVSIRSTKSITYKGCGVWAGQLFSFPVAPLARERCQDLQSWLPWGESHR